jgi:hypothetical protein
VRVGLFLIIAIICGLATSPAAFAQVNAADSIDNWSRQTGIYVTRAVKAQFPNYQATRFVRSDDYAAVDNAPALASAMRDSKLKLTPGGMRGRVVIENENGSITDVGLGSQQNRYVASLFGFNTVSGFIKKFATVRLNVKPVPPRDYKVHINDEDCAVSEKDMYIVPSGTTSVSVSRVKKPPCNWSGDIPAGEEHLVSCKL